VKKLVLAAALALAACAPAGLSTTTARGVIAADALYTSASLAGHDAVVAGAMTGERYRDLDNQAYAILLRIRAGKARIDELQPVAALLGVK
jgi:hypothetical protein